MPTLILSTVPAKRNGACISTSYDLTGTVPDPLPRETVEIRTAADAQTAFDAYRSRAEAGGRGAQVRGRLADGDRAPRGFRALTLSDYVCLDAPAMVAQPVQQQQAKARAPRPARGERRYVTVRDTETGEVHRVLTSVARVGVAVVIFTPSNRHRDGALSGMLITHDDIRKAWVFNDEAEARRFLSSNRAPGERVIRAELVADPAPVEEVPAMVPQPCQQRQGKADELPAGFSLEQDSDGDWVLIPPADVTVFSVPGEPYLIGACGRDVALSDALAVLRDIAGASA